MARPPADCRPIRLTDAEWQAIHQALRDASSLAGLRAGYHEPGTRAATTGRREADRLAALAEKIGPDGEVAAFLGVRPSRKDVRSFAADPRRHYLDADRALELIRARFDPPLGAWPEDADPRWMAARFVARQRAAGARPDAYALRAFLLAERWTARPPEPEAPETETGP